MSYEAYFPLVAWCYISWLRQVMVRYYWVIQNYLCHASSHIIMLTVNTVNPKDLLIQSLVIALSHDETSGMLTIGVVVEREAARLAEPRWIQSSTVATAQTGGFEM